MSPRNYSRVRLLLMWMPLEQRACPFTVAEMKVTLRRHLLQVSMRRITSPKLRSSPTRSIIGAFAHLLLSPTADSYLRLFFSLPVRTTLAYRSNGKMLFQRCARFALGCSQMTGQLRARAARLDHLAQTRRT